jgi:hypothetical protein
MERFSRRAALANDIRWPDYCTLRYVDALVPQQSALRLDVLGVLDGRVSSFEQE